MFSILEVANATGLISLMGADPVPMTKEEEFERVAMCHMHVLLRVALRMVGDRGAAEDLVQETYLLAWRSFSQFQRGTNCKAWLFRIMLNLSAKRQQQLRRRPPLISLNPEDSDSLHKPFSPNTAQRFTSHEVLTALDALQEDHRSVLILSVVEGFTCKEISKILTIPMGTVMSRVSRARAYLRNKLLTSEAGLSPLSKVANSCS